VLVMAWRFDNHVIDVYFDTLTHQMTKNFVHQPLVGCSGVVCDEEGLVHVGCGHGDLIVTGIYIQEIEYFISRRAVNKSVNVG